MAKNLIKPITINRFPIVFRKIKNGATYISKTIKLVIIFSVVPPETIMDREGVELNANAKVLNTTPVAMMKVPFVSGRIFSLEFDGITKAITMNIAMVTFIHVKSEPKGMCSFDAACTK